MDVLGVHGIAQEQKDRPELLADWQLGLANGVERAARAAGRKQPVPELDICFYGDVYLSDDDEGRLEPAAKGSLADVDWIELPVDDDELGFLAETVEEVEEHTVDLGDPMGTPRVPAPLQPLARRLAQRFQAELVLQLVAALRQVKHYLYDDELAEKIRARIVADLARAPQVVVAHSLGTVVTLDTLVLHPELAAPTLITVGSPLGMRGVTSRLRRPDGSRGLTEAPGNVGRWVNIFDPGDPVAAAGGLSRIWPKVTDYTVGNEKDPHNIRRYLSKRITGESVLAGVLP